MPMIKCENNTNDNIRRTRAVCNVRHPWWVFFLLLLLLLLMYLNQNMLEKIGTENVL